MQVTELTLSTSPTVVISGDYVKAGASITVALEEGDTVEAVADEVRPLLSAAYRRALLVEMTNISSIQKRDSRVSLVKWLRRVVCGKATRNTEEAE